MKIIRLRLYIFLEKLSILHLIAIFVVIVIFFAFIYLLYSPGNNGIRTVDSEDFNFWKALYFSIVTFSSLGYGDMLPNGYSRLFSVIEVILGLALVGILIAKITSSRISYHVKRMYVSDCNRLLHRYLNQLRKNSDSINLAINLYSPNFSEIPESGQRSQEQPDFLKILEKAKRTFSKSFTDLFKTVTELKAYIELEVGSGEYFAIISIDVIKEIGNLLSITIITLDQFLMGIPEHNRIQLLTGESGKSLSNVLDILSKFCSTVQSNSNDSSTNLIFSNISNSCSVIENNILVISVHISEIGPPNQITDSSVEPQIG